MEKRTFQLQQDEEFSREFLIKMSSVYLFIVAIIFIPGLILVIKIYKLLKFQDIPMLASIFAISCSLFFLGCYFITMIIEENFYIQNPDHPLLEIYYRINSSFNFLAINLLFSAFIFDLYKWWFFLLTQDISID